MPVSPTNFPSFVKRSLNHPVLSREKELQLTRQYAETQDPAIKDSLVRHNQKAVLNIAKDFRNRGLGMLELFQLGNIGLLNGIDHFDPERGLRLLSYAGWWVRASIREALIRHRSLVRIGTTQRQRTIYSRLGTLRSQIEIDQPGLTLDQQIPLIAEQLGFPLKDVTETVGRLTGHDLSLDAPMGEDDAGNFLDQLTYDTLASTELLVGNKELESRQVELLDRAYKALTERELFIIQHRFLMNPRKTLRELGEMLGISRERVRQLEVRAKNKMHDLFETLGVQKLDDIAWMQSVDPKLIVRPPSKKKRIRNKRIRPSTRKPASIRRKASPTKPTTSPKTSTPPKRTEVLPKGFAEAVASDITLRLDSDFTVPQIQNHLTEASLQWAARALRSDNCDERLSQLAQRIKALILAQWALTKLQEGI